MIKLTKAGLKDLVGNNDEIIIPVAVQKEVVEAGKLKGCHDAFIVENNIGSKVIKLAESTLNYNNGDDALIQLFQKEQYDAVATDDTKLVRQLKSRGISFILPALIIYQLFRDGLLEQEVALGALTKLSEFISEDEYSTVKLIMEKE